MSQVSETVGDSADRNYKTVLSSVSNGNPLRPMDSVSAIDCALHGYEGKG